MHGERITLMQLRIEELEQRVQQLEKASQAVVDGYYHPDCVGEMHLPDFIDAPVKELQELLNQEA